MVQFLLDCGVDAPVHMVHGMSPLHAACAVGHTQVVKILLQVSTLWKRYCKIASVRLDLCEHQWCDC